MKLNLNQRKVIADVLVNISTGLVLITVVTQIFVQRNLSSYSLMIAFVGIIISVIIVFLTIRIIKK
jgi:hypothetical protein